MSDPNYQNIPIKTRSGRKIRNGFQNPRKPFDRIDFDQIEQRLVSAVSKDYNARSER